MVFCGMFAPLICILVCLNFGKSKLRTITKCQGGKAQIGFSSFSFIFYKMADRDSLGSQL